MNFSHAVPRRLNAEQLMDALTLATGVRPDFPEVPADTTAEEFPDPHVGKDGFLDLFGRPQRESACECERKTELSLPQALNLINGKTISDAVADPSGRLSKADCGGNGGPRVNRRYVPDDAEPFANCFRTRQGHDVSAHGRSTSGSRAGSALGARVNSKAFLYNR